MSYLLFLDESGHDHRSMPYEVHGGIALHASRVWSFVQEMRALEQEAYGSYLHQYQTEIKGQKLLDKDRFKWAKQEAEMMPDISRRHHAQAFLKKKLTGVSPTRNEFTAYGQASLLAARGVFRLLQAHDVKLFASAVPRGAAKPPTSHNPEDLRKDFVFLLERYSYFLKEQKETGLLIMDETERSDDRRLVQRLERYFSLTQVGRERAQNIVPTPLFVASDMTYPIQAADLCIYCLNWGFRLPEKSMDAATRPEIAEEFGPLLNRLQWRGDGQREDQVYPSYGVTYVPDLFTNRQRQ